MNIRIEEGSPLFRALARAFADPTTYAVALEARRDGVAVKVNGGMWSAPLAAVPPVVAEGEQQP